MCVCTYMHIYTYNVYKFCDVWDFMAGHILEKIDSEALLSSYLIFGYQCQKLGRLSRHGQWNVVIYVSRYQFDLREKPDNASGPRG